MKKVKTKEVKGFSGRNWEFKRFLRPKTGDLKKKKGLHPKNPVSVHKIYENTRGRHQPGPQFALQQPLAWKFLWDTVLA